MRTDPIILFAALLVLGGLVLAAQTDQEPLALIAVVGFAVIIWRTHYV